MSRKRNSRRMITIGVTTLLMVFMVLCLLTFAVLSLVSAQADRKMSAKAAERTSHYYEAENRANALLKKIDEYLIEQYNKCEDREKWEQAVFEISVETGEDVSVYQKEQGLCLSFEVPVDDQQVLTAELGVSYNTYEGAMYQIMQWQVTDRTAWEADALPVFGGMDGREKK